MRYKATLVIALLFATLLPAAPTTHHAKGLKRDKAQFQAFLKTATRRAPRRYAPANIPADGDLSAIASLCRNQGGCGSCWAYALTKALQSEYMIAGLPLPGLLDVGYLIGNCGGPVQEYGCNGGDFPAGQNFLNSKGPWGNGVDPASGRCKNLPAVATAASFVMLGDNGNTTPSDLDMVEAMNEKHVLVIDIAADDSWSNYPSGATSMQIGGRTVKVWNRTTSTSIDHMINRLGWHCVSTDPTGKYCAFDANGNSPGIVYLDMNNWDESWGTSASNGHGGYVYETRLANRAGESAAYFTINTPTPPPPSTLPTCSVQAVPSVVLIGQTVTLMVTSQNATTASVNNHPVGVPSGSAQEVPASAGTVAVSAAVSDAAGNKGTCSTSYEVKAPTPPPPPAPTCSGFLCHTLGCWLPWCSND